MAAPRLTLDFTVLTFELEGRRATSNTGLAEELLLAPVVVCRCSISLRDDLFEFWRMGYEGSETISAGE